jgi:hypothetical protein
MICFVTFFQPKSNVFRGLQVPSFGDIDVCLPRDLEKTKMVWNRKRFLFLGFCIILKKGIHAH